MAAAIIPEACEGPSPLAKSIHLDGWASDNFRLDLDHPVTCTHPDATALDLLSWAHGQMRQLHVLLGAASAGSGCELEHEVPPVLSALRHFTEPVQSVLEVAVQKVTDAQRRHPALWEPDRDLSEAL